MLSLIIPVYNEEKRIGKTLIKVFDFFEKNNIEHEIILVDDCSGDNTLEIISKYKDRITVLKNDKNMGKGYSVRKGMLYAKGDLLLFSDADLSTPIEELDKFLKYIDEFDVLIASRNMKESDIKIKQPFFRSALGKIFPFFVNLLLVKGIKDTQCGFKLFKKECAKKIFSKQRIDRWSFDVEILFIANKYGYKIKEIPVIWENDILSKVNSIFDPPKMLFELLRIKFNSLIGRY
jgi:dolichyl-phosphate beta-glucosyltransferase